MKVSLTIITNNPTEEIHASHIQLPNIKYKDNQTIHSLTTNRVHLAKKELHKINNHLFSHGFIDHKQHWHNTKTIRYKEYLEYKSITIILVKERL